MTFTSAAFAGVLAYKDGAFDGLLFALVAGGLKLGTIPGEPVVVMIVEKIQALSRGHKDIGMLRQQVEDPGGPCFAGPDIEEVRSPCHPGSPFSTT